MQPSDTIAANVTTLLDEAGIARINDQAKETADLLIPFLRFVRDSALTKPLTAMPIAYLVGFVHATFLIAIMQFVNWIFPTPIWAMPVFVVGCALFAVLFAKQFPTITAHIVCRIELFYLLVCSHVRDGLK